MVWQNILLRESVPKAWYITSNQANTDDNVDLKDPRVINVRRFKILLSEIPPALMPVLQGIIKVSVNRRPNTSSSELSLFQRSKMVAESIAEVFRDNLGYMHDDSPICKYDYYASMFSMISMLLLDDRSRTALETPIAVAFERIGNVDLLTNTLLSKFWKAAEIQIEKGQEENEKSELQRINTCIELLLAILHHLGSSKLLHNSPHTSILTTADPDDYYGSRSLLNPYHWMDNMQYKLSGLYHYLESPHLHQFSRHVLHSLLRCITQNMKVENEAQYVMKPMISKEDDPTYQTNRTALIEMGFDSDLVDTALRRFDGNGICALDNLFSRRLVEHPVEDGPPHLEITPDLECSNPLTDTEFAAGVRILVNMWYDQTLATEALRENNNLAQAALSLSRYEPTAIRMPSITISSSGPTDTIDNENDDDEYEDIDTDDEEEEIGDESLKEEEEADEARADTFSNLKPLSKKEASENLHRLNTIRDTMRTKIPQILARLVDERSDIDFEVRDLMVALWCGDSKKIPQNIKQTNRLFFGKNQGHEEIIDKRAMFKSSINKIRIFALMLREPAMQDIMSQLIATMSEFMDWFDFLDFIVTNPDLPDPKWLTTLFLILETVLAQADEPKEEPIVDVDTPTTPIQENPSPVTVTAANRTTLMNHCINLLKMETLSPDNLISTLRILVRLTKHHEAAAQFVALGGLEPLFKRPSQSFEVIKIQQAYIIMILRHIIEDKSILMNCMREWLSFWFTAPPSRYLDVSTYIRNNNSIALRDPETFIEVSSQLCRLTNPKSGNLKNIRYIGLDHIKDETITNDHYSSVVIHFLLNQLVLTQSEKEESNIKIGYTGFILQCLLELISSYPSCKHDIVVFNNNQSLDVTDSGLSNHARIRQSILFTLVNKLLPFNAINPTTDGERKRQGISMCVASLLVAMCYDTTHVSHTRAQNTPEEALTEIRKHVLDVVYRSFKDALQSSHTSTTSAKYIRYFALAELCHRILNARPASISPAAAATQSNTKEDTVLVVAKLMLEKKFVPVLISVISDVDVNFPHAKMILNSILRPLEQLTKLAIRIDRSSPEEEKKSMDKKENEEDEHDIYLPMDTDEDNDAAEEEVSDLYRNSSLAMYDGTVLEEESSEESSDDDIEMAR